MILQGKYTTAEVFTDVIEPTAISQIIDMCNLEIHKDCKIAIMPDVHAGEDCTIGTTIAFKDKVIPNLVSSDIGCGVTIMPIELLTDIDWINDFDVQVQKHIPAGAALRSKVHPYLKEVDLSKLKCINAVGIDVVSLAFGTLGGGNHYIEIDKDSKGRYYLNVHSGSRSLGGYINKYYQNLAYKKLKDKSKEIQTEVKEARDRLLAQGRQTEIPAAVEAIKQKYFSQVNVRKNMAYLTGQDLEDYLHDSQIALSYAYYSRKAIIDDILNSMAGKIVKAKQEVGYVFFSTWHNYIDRYDRIIRKGAISAKKGEYLVIPISMAEGAIIAKGKGNKNWNQSAPHGAGRLMSRSKAKEEVDLELFKESMKGIYTTSVCESTIDESCFAYKDMKDILDNIGDTVDIVEIIKPIYNYKAH